MEPLSAPRPFAAKPSEASLQTKANTLAIEDALIQSHLLLGTRGQLNILHNGERYLLRRTKQGKLILTK